MRFLKKFHFLLGARFSKEERVGGTSIKFVRARARVCVCVRETQRERDSARDRRKSVERYWKS